MPEKDPFGNEADAKSKRPLLNEEIRKRLAGISMGNFDDLPRKTKKAVKKKAQGKRLTQQEIARLATLRRRQEQEND